MGRREAQKQQRREVMLAAARGLFERQGYARTTFDEIAAASGMGVATVYKYFTSKHGLVAALLEPDLQRMLNRAQAVISRPPADPGRSMVKLLRAYADLGGHNWSSREILRLTVFPGLSNEGELTGFVRRADTETRRQIAALLRHQQAAGRLHARLPVADATAVIFALLNQHFGEFLFDPAASFPRMFAKLSRRVQLVFADWGAPNKGMTS
jgi:AcrR family transcriptional regulator